jgi:AAA+ ATPase superfamily predicted ATPase
MSQSYLDKLNNLDLDILSTNILSNTRTFKIIGKRCIGKTTLIKNIVMNLNIRLKFIGIFLFTHNEHNDDYTDLFLPFFHSINSENLSREMCCDNIDIDEQYEYMKRKFDNIIQKQTENSSKPILFICDDACYNSKALLFPLLLEYIKNNNLNIYLINASQEPDKYDILYDMIFAFREYPNKYVDILYELFEAKDENEKFIITNILINLADYECGVKINTKNEYNYNIHCTKASYIKPEKRLKLSCL